MPRAALEDDAARPAAWPRPAPDIRPGMTTTLTRAAATAALLGALLATAPAATAATHSAPRAAASTPHTHGLLDGHLGNIVGAGITGGILTPISSVYNGLGTWLNSTTGGLLGGSVLDITDLLTGTASGVGTAA